MGADAVAKPRKPPFSSEQQQQQPPPPPADAAADAGKSKHTKQRRGGPRTSSDDDAGLKRPAVGAEASSDDSGKERSSGQGAPDGEKMATSKIAGPASEVEKGEQSKTSSVASEGKKKESLRDTGDSEGEHDKRSSKRSSLEDDAAVEATRGERSKRGKPSGPAEPTGEEAAAAAVADGGASNKRAVRQWSEDDVKKLLRGIVECQEEHGMEAFPAIDLISRHLHETQGMEFTRTQLYEKIRRLKQKFESAVKGGSPALAKPHDQAVFELSKKIWTVEKPTDPVAVAGNGGTGSGVDEVETRAAGGLYPHLKEAVGLMEKEGSYYMRGGLLNKGFELLKPSKAKKLEERWRANCLAGMKFLLEGCKLKEELLEACAEALDSNTP